MSSPATESNDEQLGRLSQRREAEAMGMDSDERRRDDRLLRLPSAATLLCVWGSDNSKQCALSWSGCCRECLNWEKNDSGAER